MMGYTLPPSEINYLQGTYQGHGDRGFRFLFLAKESGSKCLRHIDSLNMNLCVE